MRDNLAFEAERAKQHRLQMQQEAEDSNPLFAAAMVLGCMALVAFLLAMRWVYLAVTQ